MMTPRTKRPTAADTKSATPWQAGLSRQAIHRMTVEQMDDYYREQRLRASVEEGPKDHGTPPLARSRATADTDEHMT